MGCQPGSFRLGKNKIAYIRNMKRVYSSYLEYFLIYYVAVAGSSVRWGPGHTADTTNHPVPQNAFPGM